MVKVLHMRTRRQYISLVWMTRQMTKLLLLNWYFLLQCRGQVSIDFLRDLKISTLIEAIEINWIHLRLASVGQRWVDDLLLWIEFYDLSCKRYIRLPKLVTWLSQYTPSRPPFKLPGPSSLKIHENRDPVFFLPNPIFVPVITYNIPTIGNQLGTLP